MTPKTPSETKSEITQILPYYAINGNGRLLGGFLLNCIDEVATASAKRFCRTKVATAAIDSVDFIAPAFIGELFTATGVVTRAGKTSLEVKVSCYIENDDGTRRLINRAYAVFVALSEDGKPIPVPELLLQTDEEKAEYAAACKRDEERKKRRAAQKAEK